MRQDQDLLLPHYTALVSVLFVQQPLITSLCLAIEASAHSEGRAGTFAMAGAAAAGSSAWRREIDIIAS